VVLAGVVDGHDRRVVQARRRLRFATEPIEEGGIAGKIGSQQLDRHISAETPIAPAMDLGHTAIADELTELVPAPNQAWRRHE
jgi:hypothetical protein